MGDMGLEYGNEKRVCTPFDVMHAFLISVLIVSKFVGEYETDGRVGECPKGDGKGQGGEARLTEDVPGDITML